MTVSAQTPINRSTGNGVTTVFPYQFKIIAEADIEVTVDDVVKTLNVDYTLSGVGVDAGGNVTFTVAPANATTVVRRRNMALTRTTDYQDQGALPAETLDQDIDSTVLMIQQLDDQIGRSITIPAGITGFDTELPDPVASRFLRINSTGDAIEYVSEVTPGALAVSAYIETLLDDATAAAARTTLGAAASGLATASGLTMSTAKVLGRTTALTGAIEEMTAAQVAAFTAAASTTAQGVSELATTAEAQTGTDATRTLTPSTMKAAQIQPQTAVTLTTQTAVDFTSIPTWANRITMLFSGVSTNGTSAPIVQLGDSGGFETSGYTGNVSLGSNGVAWTVGATPAAGFGISTSTAAGSSYTGKLILNRINGNEWIASGDWAQTTATITTNLLTGAKTLSATLTQVRLTTSGGSDQFDAGTVNISLE